ncbi:MAG: type II secretion system F family protein, partial [Bacillota bacterium]|nr:type II secretion system F family protein [Bacillota bacterium]
MEARIETVSELQLTDLSDEPEELHLPLIERIFYPLLRSAGRSLQALAPSGLKTKLAKRLGVAGLKVTAEQYSGWYLVGAVGGLLVGIFIVLTGGKTGAQAVFLSLALAGGGAMLPELKLRQHITKRQLAIVRALPDVLDLLTVSVKAGLGFDSALLKVTEKMKGPLPQEMGQVLHEVKMGVTRRDALKSLADRTGVKELQSFVGTIIQADQLGVSISNVLTLQSEALREHRRQVAEEKAMKAPVKMLFPLVLFIFPTLFIVL